MARLTARILHATALHVCDAGETWARLAMDLHGLGYNYIPQAGPKIKHRLWTMANATSAAASPHDVPPNRPTPASWPPRPPGTLKDSETTLSGHDIGPLASSRGAMKTCHRILAASFWRLMVYLIRRRECHAHEVS